MKKIKIAKAIIKFDEQYFVISSNSPIKKWKFFDVNVAENENEIGKLSKELLDKLNITQSPGKIFCQINLFQNGIQYDITIYKLNIRDEKVFENINFEYKLLLISELKTLKWEDIDKIIFQKILDKNPR